VAGPSSSITPIYDRLREFLAQLRAADGTPVIGMPRRILDYSEITAQFPVPLENIFSSSVRKLLAQTIDGGAGNKEIIPIPAIIVQALSQGEDYAGIVTPGEPKSFTLSLRTGTKIGEWIYFSAAPLDTEAHLSYLNKLESALGRD
jgi:hypothetical protein